MRATALPLCAPEASLERRRPAQGVERRLRILIATDAWRPQVNGVVRTLEGLVAEAPSFGADIVLLTPDRFASLPMPTYPEIRLALATERRVARFIEPLAPDAIHIATEGPIGCAVRSFCRKRGVPFTTCYHTRFPEYIAARLPVPLAAGYAVMRRFHAPAAATMVATPSLARELRGRGFSNLHIWRRGVDVDTFASGSARLSLPRPIFLTVCRVAVEKNLDAFLSLDLPGSKVVVGDGPARKDLERRFPEAHFLGAAHGRDLADLYRSADVFVFPSRTDTFGLVILEALAAGAPVAAFADGSAPDVLGDSGCGVLDMDLSRACLGALDISRDQCCAFAAHHTIRESARSFLQIVREALGLSFDAPSLERAKAPA
jgi:glycosyltransferase involved in cell wall biosynthesis